MAKFSDKRMGKEVGSAAVYAKPHTMAGKEVKPEVSNETGAQYMQSMNMSVGNVSKGNYEPTEKAGIKIRGTGAATKGVMARGPMA